jgi:hypothetical protein
MRAKRGKRKIAFTVACRPGGAGAICVIYFWQPAAYRSGPLLRENWTNYDAINVAM